MYFKNTVFLRMCSDLAEMGLASLYTCWNHGMILKAPILGIK